MEVEWWILRRKQTGLSFRRGIDHFAWRRLVLRVCDVTMAWDPQTVNICFTSDSYTDHHVFPICFLIRLQYASLEIRHGWEMRHGAWNAMAAFAKSHLEMVAIKSIHTRNVGTEGLLFLIIKSCPTSSLFEGDGLHCNL
jgi:hypothetical protein